MEPSIIKAINNKKYIRAELLKPYDVILSRGKSLNSTIIAKMNNGLYSHASLVIGALTHFEADSIGLGYTYIRISKVEIHDDCIRWLWDISDKKEIAVYRHPNIMSLNDSELKESIDKLIDIVTKLIGYEYPQLGKLVKAWTKPTRYPKVKKFILDTMEKIRFKGEKKVVPGLFCSALVASCFDELGYNIFFTTIDPNEVGPNQLCNPSISRLQKVTGIICSLNPDIPNDEEFQNILNFIVNSHESRQEFIEKEKEIKKAKKDLLMFAEKFDFLDQELLDKLKKLF